MNESLGPFNLVLLALPGIGLKFAIWAMYSRRATAAADPMKILLSTASTLLLIVAAAGGVLGLIGTPSSPLGFIFFWLPVIVVLLIAILMALDRYRHGEHRALVWSLAAAAQRGIPLSEAARAYADETLGDTGARALGLARGVEAGLPLSAATRAARLRLATPMTLAIRLGEALGMLGQAMRQQIEDSAEIDAALRGAITRFIYLGNLVIAAAGIETYLMITIIPVFEKMFDEFGLALPPPTILTVRLANFCVEYGWVGVIPLSDAGLTVCAGGRAVLPGLVPARTAAVAAFSTLRWGAGHAGPRFDGPPRLAHDRGAAAVGNGVSVWRYRAAATYGSPARRAGGRLDRGPAASEADRAGRRGGAACRRAGRQPALALEEMAESAQRRQVYRLQVAVNLLFPLAIVAMAMLGGLFAIGVFMPLVALIQGLA